MIEKQMIILIDIMKKFITNEKINIDDYNQIDLNLLLSDKNEKLSYEDKQLKDDVLKEIFEETIRTHKSNVTLTLILLSVISPYSYFKLFVACIEDLKVLGMKIILESKNDGIEEYEFTKKVFNNFIHKMKSLEKEIEISNLNKEIDIYIDMNNKEDNNIEISNLINKLENDLKQKINKKYLKP